MAQAVSPCCFLLLTGNLRQKNWQNIAPILAQSCPFPVNLYLVYFVQSKLCKAAALVGVAAFHL